MCISISPQCQSAIAGIVTSPQGQCLNPSGLIGLVTTPSSASIIPAVNSWLVGESIKASSWSSSIEQQRESRILCAGSVHQCKPRFHHDHYRHRVWSGIGAPTKSDTAVGPARAGRLPADSQNSMSGTVCPTAVNLSLLDPLVSSPPAQLQTPFASRRL
jgi:hypothetical protein